MTTAEWIGISLVGVATAWGWWALGREIVPDAIAGIKASGFVGGARTVLSWAVSMAGMFLVWLYPFFRIMGVAGTLPDARGAWVQLGAWSWLIACPAVALFVRNAMREGKAYDEYVRRQRVSHPD
jgi:hypothetical protein